MEYIPKVLQAVAGEDFTIYLYFSDGSVRLYDAKPLLQLGGVFEPMRDPDYFRDRLTVLNDTAAWDVSGDMDPCNCIDLVRWSLIRWKRHPEIKHNGTALVHHRICAVP